MAYIDREKFLKKSVECFGHFGVLVKAIEEIANECTEEDVVKVVRCKDCKYLTKEMIGGDLEFICKSAKGMVNPAPDFYCSYGERKEDE